MFRKTVTRRTALGLMTGVSSFAVLAPAAIAETVRLQDLTGQLKTLPALTLFTARRVITMEGDDQGFDAVAIVGERIVAAGRRDELERLIGEQAYRVDDTFADKVIIAGFVEPHLHPVLGAVTLTLEIISIEDWDLPTGLSKAAQTPEDYMARLVAAEAAMDDPDEPLVTWGYHNFWHGDVRRPDLDAINSRRPIMIFHRSTHELILNTPALAYTGITEELVNSFDGTPREQMDFEGGHFFEQGGIVLLDRLGTLLATPDRLMAGLAMTRDYCHMSGITMATEPGGTQRRELQEAQNQIFGASDAPFNMFYVADALNVSDHYQGDADLIDATDALLEWGEGRAQFLPKQVKLFTDGAIFSLLMQMSEPYIGDFHGEWIMNPEFFDELFDQYWAAGFQIHVHQTGDGGLDLLLDAVERNMRSAPRPDHRTVVVHFGYAREDQCERLTRLGCIVSANPYYVTALADRYAEIGLGPDRADDIVPLGFVKANSVPICLHSDMPMAPAQPLYLVWSAVNRTTSSGRVAGPEHRLTVEEALRGVTIEAAYSVQLERDYGSIAPGKYANFTILEDDPFEVDPDEIRNIGIWGTVVEGRIQQVPEAQRRSRASLFPAQDAATRLTAAALTLTPRRSALEQVAATGCSCCGSPGGDSCGPGETASEVSVGCCSTNALGMAMITRWAGRV